MRILVTGGAGFIGSALVDELTAGGHEVVVLDEREPVSRPGVTAVTGDVREAQAWESALPGVEAVAHLAAKVGLARQHGTGHQG